MISSKKKDDEWVAKVANKSDIFSRRAEDPFLLIKQAEKKVINKFFFYFFFQFLLIMYLFLQERDAILDNPLRMEDLRKKIANELAELEALKAKKEENKLRKKMKKEKKDRKNNHEKR